MFDKIVVGILFLVMAYGVGTFYNRDKGISYAEEHRINTQFNMMRNNEKILGEWVCLEDTLPCRKGSIVTITENTVTIITSIFPYEVINANDTQIILELVKEMDFKLLIDIIDEDRIDILGSPYQRVK